MDTDGIVESLESVSSPQPVVPQKVSISPDEIVHESLSELRLKKIDQYQREGLANPDATQANLASGNAALMRVSLQLEDVTAELLAKPSNSLERFERIRTTLDSQLKVMRQVDRFMRLGHDLQNGSHKTLENRG